MVDPRGLDCARRYRRAEGVAGNRLPRHVALHETKARAAVAFGRKVELEGRLVADFVATQGRAQGRLHGFIDHLVALNYEKQSANCSKILRRRKCGGN